jgi:glycosyltransferase involved in cell wall biosynthesis
VKVAVVYHDPDPQAGGYFTFQRTVVDTLRAQASGSAHEFRYYAAAPSPPSDAGVTWLGAETEPVPRRAARLAAAGARAVAGQPQAWTPTRLDEVVARDGVQLVWFVSNHLEATDLPFIVTVWDLAHRELPWFPEVSAGGVWAHRERIHREFLPRAARVVVPNEAGAAQVERYYAVPRDRQLLLAHPTPRFAREAASAAASADIARERYGIKAPFLLYPAQLWPHKNHVTALRALAELPDLHLVCPGTEPTMQPPVGQRAHLENAARELGVSDRVHFLGFVEQDELVSFYRHARALLYLSFFGPENLPPLEAFALGLPVINADIPGAREQLGDAALLVPPTDPQAIAAAVRSLEDDGVRNRLIAAGRARSDELTPESYVQGVIEFLDEFQAMRSTWA